MTDDEFSAWKRERGFDAPPPPVEARPVNCDHCGTPEPCGCVEMNHADDESGTYVTIAGKLVMLNEGGHNGTTIDLRVLVAWMREHRPDLL